MYSSFVRKVDKSILYLNNAWVSPEGERWSCIVEHAVAAKHLLKVKYNEFSLKPLVDLHKKGWVRVSEGRPSIEVWKTNKNFSLDPKNVLARRILGDLLCEMPRWQVIDVDFEGHPTLRGGYWEGTVEEFMEIAPWPH